MNKHCPYPLVSSLARTLNNYDEKTKVQGAMRISKGKYQKRQLNSVLMRM